MASSCPKEILREIFQHLDVGHLKDVRLVCAQFDKPARDLLFRKAILYPDDISLRKLEAISQSSEHQRLVRNLTITRNGIPFIPRHMSGEWTSALANWVIFVKSSPVLENIGPDFDYPKYMAETTDLSRDELKQLEEYRMRYKHQSESEWLFTHDPRCVYRLGLASASLPNLESFRCGVDTRHSFPWVPEEESPRTFLDV